MKWDGWFFLLHRVVVGTGLKGRLLTQSLQHDQTLSKRSFDGDSDDEDEEDDAISLETAWEAGPALSGGAAGTACSSP